ncbi:hypothetical protein [Actinomadura gamaensis]|uniref:Uncharacterized protein n=1 Tax=Actinomadura gamaensis TaxID=1763541 RepID=A0ABV9TX75_9ACTN
MSTRQTTDSPRTAGRWWVWPLGTTVTYLAAAVATVVTLLVRSTSGHDPWGKGLGEMFAILGISALLGIGLFPLLLGWALFRSRTKPKSGIIALAASIFLALLALLTALTSGVSTPTPETAPPPMGTVR